MPPKKSLESFPRPAVAVDLAVLTVVDAGESEDGLRVLLLDRQSPDGVVLPGGLMRERTTVAETVDDVFARKLMIAPPTPVEPHFIHVFDDPDRDDRTWALSLAHVLPLPEAALAGCRGRLVPVDAEGLPVGVGPLLFDHDTIVRRSVAWLRDRYDYRGLLQAHDVHPDPDGFLDGEFTLLQLRKVHESVIGAPLHKDNFAKRMLATGELEPVLEHGRPKTGGRRGRPAALYRRRT